jgi:BolA protein
VTADRSAAIRARLVAALAPQELQVIDESHLHAGHAGAAGGAGHYAVVVVSAGFAGLSPLERHRRVYAALADLMPHEIHALRITARVPGE